MGGRKQIGVQAKKWDDIHKMGQKRMEMHEKRTTDRHILPDRKKQRLGYERLITISFPYLQLIS